MQAVIDRLWTDNYNYEITMPCHIMVKKLHLCKHG